MAQTGKRRAKDIGGELLVPAIMLAFASVYWWDAAGLSAEALAFPLALTAVIVLASLIIVATAIVSVRQEETNNAESTNNRKGALALAGKTWLIVLIPVPLVYFWRDLGAISVFFVYSISVLLILGERRWLWLALVTSFLAIGLVYLFKTLLYVRLPDIPWIFVS
jgi:cell division protein FtsW (lipid II flippase)